MYNDLLIYYMIRTKNKGYFRDDYSQMQSDRSITSLTNGELEKADLWSSVHLVIVNGRKSKACCKQADKS